VIIAILIILKKDTRPSMRLMVWKLGGNHHLYPEGWNTMRSI